MTNSDIKGLSKAYVNVKPSILLTETYGEGTTVLPTIIKVKEIYEGGPHSGETNVVYRIIGRMGNVVKAACENDPNLTMQISIDNPDVTTTEDAYIVSANFKWDDKRKTYHPINEFDDLHEEDPRLALGNLGGAQKYLTADD
jgi:hypothetical protein